MTDLTEDQEVYFASMSRADMRQILINHSISCPPDLTRREMIQLIVVHNIGGPPTPQTTDTDTPFQLFRLLEIKVLEAIAAKYREVNMAALTQRIYGQIDALDWIMSQIDEIRTANEDYDPDWATRDDKWFGDPPEAYDGPCNTCQGRGWVRIRQTMGDPEGEQVACPDCTPTDHGHSVMMRDLKGQVVVKRNGKWVPARVEPILLPPVVAKAMAEQQRAERAWMAGGPDPRSLRGQTDDGRLSWDIS